MRYSISPRTLQIQQLKIKAPKADLGSKGNAPETSVVPLGSLEPRGKIKKSMLDANSLLSPVVVQHRCGEVQV